MIKRFLVILGCLGIAATIFLTLRDVVFHEKESDDGRREVYESERR